MPTGAARMPTKEELQGGFSLGDWEVLPGHRELRRGDQVERPEPKVFDVLLALAQRDTNIVTKQNLIDEVWEGRATTDEPITRCLYQLRGHLDDRQKPHQLVQTLHSKGYRLKKTVELHHPAEPEAAPAAEPKTGPSMRMWKMVAAILGAGFIGLIIYLWVLPPPPAAHIPVKSIVIVPFQNLSGDTSDDYLVSGFKEELVVMLANVDDFTVKNGRRNYDLETP